MVMEICFLLFNLYLSVGVLSTLKFDGTRKSKRLTCLFKLTKPPKLSCRSCSDSLRPLPSVGHSHIAARDLWSSVQMPSHLFSPSLCAEESVVLTRIQTHITGTARRNVNVPVRVCACFVFVRYKGSYIARLVAHLSPVLIQPFPVSYLIWTLSLQRTHTREKNKNQLLGKSSQKFTLQYC